ncbi:MAG: pyroglutamyl-peptidase I [Lachnospiraceae bacterium]
MKILITGFEPFGGETLNPAYEAVKFLPATIAGAQIIKTKIPTSFANSYLVVEQKIKTYHPDIILNTGQGGGRSEITIEKVAINFADARIPDNDGIQPSEEVLEPNGETAYFATIPVKQIVKNIQDHGISASISYSAGTYVCNCLMYRVLFAATYKYPWLKAGFIHVPFSEEQIMNKPAGTPCMSVSTITKGLTYAIEAIVSEEKDNC